MWAPRHHLPPVKVGSPHHQLQQAGRDTTDEWRMQKAAWSLHTLPCSWPFSGPGFAGLRPYKAMVSTHLGPSHDTLLVSADAPGAEERYVIHLHSMLYTKSCLLGPMHSCFFPVATAGPLHSNQAYKNDFGW